MSLTQRILHTIFTLLSIVLISIFAVWWFQLNHIPSNIPGLGILDYFLFGILTFVIWHPIVMNIFTWLVISHIPPHPPTIEPQKGLKVAFLTTFVPVSEDPELLHRCLPAMIAADYPHDTWLLDEGNDPRAREICETYGVRYFTRNGQDEYNQLEGKFKAKTKGGNHNAWHDCHGHDYDIVAQIDTDFVPSTDFLTKTLGYFRDPKIGFVGTPQIYGNTDDSLIAQGAAEQTFSFYGPVLRGLSGMQANTLIGANHIIRTKALESVDHYSAHITEDLLTGMKLHAKGWKSTYVPKVLAIGEGPTDWESYLNQQMRWAYGCMDILKNFSFKLFRSMSPRQQIYYFLLQQHYFSGLVMALGICSMITYFWFDLDLATIELYPFLFLYLPILVGIEAMNIWIQTFNVRPEVERGLFIPARILHIVVWLIYFLAFIGVIRGKKLTYKVTPKGSQKVVSGNSLQLFRPHFMIVGLVLITLVSILFTGRDALVMIGWSVITVIMMLIVPFLEPLYQMILPIVQRVKQWTKPRFSIERTIRYAFAPSLGVILLGSWYIQTFESYQQRVDLPERLTETAIDLPIRKVEQSPVVEVVSREEEDQDTIEELSSIPDQYTLFTRPGEGTFKLSRVAINEYLKDTQQTLTPEQLVYAETMLQQEYTQAGLEVGEEVIFTTEEIIPIVIEAQNLSPQELISWSKFTLNN